MCSQPTYPTSVYYKTGFQSLLKNTPRQFHLPIKTFNTKYLLFLFYSFLRPFTSRHINAVCSYDDFSTAYKKFNILNGYFQESFAFNDSFDSYWLQSYNILFDSLYKTNNTVDFSNQLSIHVRKSDYIDFKSIYHPLPPEYFVNAAADALNTYSNINKVVFYTDSPHWVISNIIPKLTYAINAGKYSIDISTDNEIDTFYCLCNSHHIIISNSTFSLCAAKISSLILPNRTLIQPKFWFTDQPNHLFIR